MELYVSWGLFLIFGGGAVYYYTQHGQGKGRVRSARAASVADNEASRPDQRREKVKPKRKPNAATPQRPESDAPRPVKATAVDTGSASETSKQRKGGKKPAQQQAASKPAVVASQASVSDGEEEEGNKEWARQLAGLKKGTSLAPPERANNRSKTVRQSAASAETRPSTTSSTTGADADDDLSPALSPSLGASSHTVPSGRDVSDMLEAPAASPSVLRLTESSQPARVKKPQQQKPAESAETKKQRQNRRKVEERKLAREQEEKERRALEEKQRRTAREARGEPAKNGMAPAAAPASNAWTATSQSKAPNGTTSTAPAVGAAPLLDTFDAHSTASSDGAGTGTNTTSINDGMSEEEQMRLLQESQDWGWNTVPKGRKAKKRAGNEVAGDTTGNESSDTGIAQAAPALKEFPAAPAASTNTPAATNTSAGARLLNDGFNTSADVSAFMTSRHPGDSDWAVL
ncbi:hypothetical protein H2199_001812 [Coniosporium tulheliwenetii]|uniref:Uncharacterized protein n=1 Tax=Coniosporium tulheliwenetii TaxID=3383036 RepID=A0ACC2ZKF0_9PEZI|nr:hypothetical protein H2199_001812 [Cladosporium sp. JES 115]